VEGALGDEVLDPNSPSLLKYDAKVLRGKNGRLFLDNDTNQIIKQLSGELLFTDRELRDWQAVLESRTSWLEKLGCRYFMIVPPNAHLVYPEDLPDSVRLARVRPILQLIRHLEDSQSSAQLIYPLEEILAAKPHPLLYPLTDTHWTAHAAFVAYQCLAREIAPVVPMNVVLKEDLVYYEVPWMGELGFKVDPKEESLTVTASVRRPPARLISDNRVINTGLVVVTECPEAPPTKCLIFGDSFTHGLLQPLASSFRRVVFACLTTVDHELVREEQPDVVISVTNERFFMRVPKDIGSTTVREHERDKKSRGLLRGHTLPYWNPDAA
jgi:alginate O-acetyltransferase complex protein AlgJ